MKISAKTDKILSILAKLPLKRICVIGDLIVDHYRILSPKRLSPEAPVVIFEQDQENFLPGGAANVVANLTALNVGSVHLLSVCGSINPKAYDALNYRDSKLIVVNEKDRLTTVKERIITRRQQIARIDHQSDQPIKIKTAEAILKYGKEAIEEADAIVFSDYDHGVCIPELVRPIMEIAARNSAPVIVDSKAKDTILKYKGATIALPNMDEARLMTKLDDFEDEQVARFLMRTMNLKAAAITLGPRGIILATPDETRIFPPLHQDVIEKEVVDVTGAGDTVAATVAIGLVSQMAYPEIMKLANITAGIKVQKRGVATVSEKEIIQTIEQNIDLL